MPSDEQSQPNDHEQPTRIPATLPVGDIQHIEVDGEALVAIGTAPYGLTALLTEKGWTRLLQWKLDRLIISGGRVCAMGKDYKGKPHVARILTGVLDRTSLDVVPRNGHFLDLRETNLAVMPRRTVAKARQQRNDPDPPSTTTMVCSDGRIRSYGTGSTADVRYDMLLGKNTDDAPAPTHPTHYGYQRR